MKLICSVGIVNVVPETAVFDETVAIMLVQLETIVMITEAIKLAFFRLVEYQQLWVRLQTWNGHKHRTSETRLSVLVLRNEGYSMREITKNLNISY